ncbi:MAG: DoxX family protein [Bacillota bacterium]
MNIVLWILQAFLAAHTVMGAVWKFSHSEKSVRSLSALPHGVWLGMSVFEFVCAVGLFLTAIAPLAVLAPLAAIGIAAEMLLLCVVHLLSGDKKYQHMMYWLVVAVISAFIAYGRFEFGPI